MAGLMTVCWRCRASSRRGVDYRVSTFLDTALARTYTRPSTAPKPALDVKHIVNNPGLYQQNCVDRNYNDQSENPWKILDLVKQRVELQKLAKNDREANKSLEKEIKEHREAWKEAEDKDPKEALLLKSLFNKAREYKEELGEVTDKERHIYEQIEQLALALPNLSSTHTPTGAEPYVLEVIREEFISQNQNEKSHVDIGTELDLLDFTGAATASGWGWYYLKNEAALLEQALIQYTLGVLVRRGWQIVSPPSMVYSHISAACGFQPKDHNDEQQTYQIHQTEKDKYKPSMSLAATAEIPLAGMQAGTILPQQKLPLKTAAVSRCYRAEAGARGVDTKGLYRVHEFTKVEMFAWTVPDGVEQESGPSQSSQMFSEMIEVQREILDTLGLSYRILEMPSSDLGGPASRKQDIEVFFPSRRAKDQGWGEVTSTSLCTDYQSRRLNTRLKLKNGELSYPHTLNGTALAIPRILAAVLENGWDEQSKTVKVPDGLKRWMVGVETIGQVQNLQK